MRELQGGILIGRDLKWEDYVESLGLRAALITDETLASLYSSKFPLFSFPSGERYKTRATKEQLEDALFAHGFGRDTCLIAFGGGVVTDLAGFLAATYCRGIPHILVPTTLLSMVDASIGGKTGVNHPCGKNLVGAFYPPKKVFIDLSYLSTLPLRELKNGVVEIIKHALIASRSLFDCLEERMDDLLALDLEDIVFESCRIKLEIVEGDEKECDKRRLLNFGHTCGHALETLSDYTLPHGEAVALGILMESYLAFQMKRLDFQSLERIVTLLSKEKLWSTLPLEVDPEAFWQAMQLDKKSIRGSPRFVILERIGHASQCIPVEKKLVLNSLEWIYHALCAH